MDKDPAISIIVPVYNSSKYLSKCIDSIIAQTFSDFELILVNDGSTDKSGSTCNEYSEKDSRVKVIHKRNGGVSSARNAGLDVAKGDYIGWVDSDDYIENDMFEFLYNLSKNQDADISECSYATVYNGKLMPGTFGKGIEYGEGNFLIEKYLMEDIFYGIVTKLFRRSLFENIRFPVSRIWEDIWLVTHLCMSGIKYVRDPQVKYYYRQTENSIIRSSATPRKAREAIYLLESSLKLVNENAKNPILEKRLFKRNMEKAVFHYLGLALAEDKALRGIYSKLYLKRMNFSVADCFLSKSIPLRNKVSYLFCRMHLSRIAFRLKKILS